MEHKAYPGILLTIEGTDGSGKGTQARRLRERLVKEGYEVEEIDFPQYGEKSSGLVEEYLNGHYGSAKEVGPYRGSVFFAVDRYDAAMKKMLPWLREGKTVIANRYVPSNMAHQGGKIADREERRKFFDWIERFEYELMGIPRPDANIILHVDACVAQEMVDKKAKRDYIDGGKKRDIHEADIGHLRDAEKVYVEMARYPNFYLIECSPSGKIMTIEEIHDLVWEKVREVLKR